MTMRSTFEPARRKGTRWLPMKPAPPETKTLRHSGEQSWLIGFSLLAIGASTMAKRGEANHSTAPPSISAVSASVNLRAVRLHSDRPALGKGTVYFFAVKFTAGPNGKGGRVRDQNCP